MNANLAKRVSFLFAVLSVCLACCGVSTLAQHLSVTNPVEVSRSEEIVDLPLSEVLHHVSGIDVWSKRVPNFVIDNFYKRDAEGQRTKNKALSYHKDNGQGWTPTRSALRAVAAGLLFLPTGGYSLQRTTSR